MDIEIKIPDIGKDVVEIIEVLVKVGDVVSKNDALVMIEGQKASVEIPTPYNGIVKNIIVNVGSKVTTGSLILILESISNITENSNLSSSTFKPNKVKKFTSQSDNSFIKSNSNDVCKISLVHASPTVRRLSRKLNIKLEKITGTGRKNRILKEDVLLYKDRVCNEEHDSDFIDINKNINDDCNDQNMNIQKKILLTKIQKKSSEHLTQSWFTIPHVTQFDEFDITELEDFRKKYNSSVQDDGLKLTVLVFVIKAVAKALQVFPKFNSYLSKDKDDIFLVVKKDIHIGIAVDTNNGLLVPLIHYVNKKNITELLSELHSVSQKARSGKLELFNVNKTIGSFTISNLGGIGGIGFTPIINYPEIAILGISKASIKPYWNNTQFIPKLVLPISLSYDHRAIDGVEAVKFINFISKLLSDIRFLVM